MFPFILYYMYLLIFFIQKLKIIQKLKYIHKLINMFNIITTFYNLVNGIIGHGNIKKKKMYGGYTLDEGGGYMVDEGGGYTADNEDNEDNAESTFGDKSSFQSSVKSNNESENTETFMVDGLEQILLKVLKL